MSRIAAPARTFCRGAGAAVLVLSSLVASGAEPKAAASSPTGTFHEPGTAFTAQRPGPTAHVVSERVVVTGAVESALALNVDDLKAFPADQIISVSETRRGDDKGLTSTVRGVRLTAVLERAGLAGGERNQWRHTAVVAIATDGYRVVFSWPELFNTEVGAGVLVVFERDGAALGEREGRIALISARDLRRGPRSVKWLARLDVRVLTD